MTDIAMTDLEITRLCAEAMGWRQHAHSASLLYNEKSLTTMSRASWNPLHDDAQAMALVKKLHLHIDYRPGRQLSVQPPYFEFLVTRTDNDLNRAICECAANVQLAKATA